jgi:hypothetical protein
VRLGPIVSIKNKMSGKRSKPIVNIVGILALSSYSFYYATERFDQHVGK